MANKHYNHQTTTPWSHKHSPTGREHGSPMQAGFETHKDILPGLPGPEKKEVNSHGPFEQVSIYPIEEGVD